MLYDVTSTYFEGVAEPAIAERGHSRDHRPDCVQINIALVVTREGMPLGYEIFSGGTTDVTTVEQIVESMESRFGKVNRVWVMDRGMVSAKNIAWLNATKRRYVIGAARIIYTDISRDGTREGVNLDETRKIARAVRIPIIASGGVATLDDIRALKPLEKEGVEGVIVGRALYAGAFTLKDTTA